MRKTLAEIEALKRNWLADPIWDIETTKGFEQHKKELKEFRLDVEKKHNLRRSQELRIRALEFGCSVRLVEHLEILEHRIETLQLKVLS
jgi:hypothetical protein